MVGSLEVFVCLVFFGVVYCLILCLQIILELESGVFINMMFDFMLLYLIFWYYWQFEMGVLFEISEVIIVYVKSVLF